MKSKYLKSKGKHRAEESQKSPDTFNYADAREFLEDVEGETAQLIKNNRFTRLKQGLDRESKALEKAIDDETITASSIKSRLDSLKEKARIISENERIVHAARIAVTDFLNPLIHGNFEFIAFEYPIEDMLLNPALARWAETSAKGFPVGERIGATFLPMDHHSAFSGPAVLRGYFYSPGEEGLRRFGIPLIYNPAAGREAGEFGRRMLKENFAVMRDEKWIHSVMANRAEIAFKYYVGLIKELSNYAQTFQKNFNALTPRKILARQRRLPKEAEKTDRPYDLQIGRGKYLPIQEQEFNSLWAVRGDWERAPYSGTPGMKPHLIFTAPTVKKP